MNSDRLQFDLDKVFPPQSKAKLVSVTAQEDGTLQLRKYVGRKSKGEAQMTIDEETTVEGIKAVIEEFRAK